ncbi:chitinase N-terminal domain-containing protein [Teredinibacter franksiae]|uniref:chitinase N-terminal domain-containing protein n=1 Tax=Teredinibacter franksiae TaxID=2761453 RepID=UPI00162ACB07|nr:chitinase N-terminal domain-containing protein [Teredinibacter franksiae]
MKKNMRKNIVSYLLVVLGCFFAASIAAETYSFGSFSSGVGTARYTDSDGTFKLTWSSLSGTEYYRLKLGGWTLNSSSSLSYAQSGLSPYKYVYTVYACYIEEDEYDEDDNWEVCRKNPTTIEVTVPSTPPSKPSMTGTTSSTSGSYTVSWNSVSGTTNYRWRTRTNGGGWSGDASRTSTSFSVSGKGTGRYGYQVRACNSAGCSGYSAERTVTVSRAPGTPPSLGQDRTPSDPTVVVSWGASSGTVTQYNFDYKKSTTSSWSNGYDGASRSKTLSGLSVGNWNYRVKACNTYYGVTACSGWKTANGVIQTVPSGVDAPFLVEGGVNSSSGSYTLRWNEFEYTYTTKIERSVNGGSYVEIPYSEDEDEVDTWYLVTVRNQADGYYRYRIKECNAIGCGYSNALQINVARKPATPGVPSGSPNLGDGAISISWGSSSYATTYDLEYSKNGGSYVNSYDGSFTSTNVNYGAGSYVFRVRACNVRGSFTNCSGWRYSSSAVTVAAPGSVPSLTVPADDNNGSYSVSWGSVTNSRNYTLQERTGTGSWATLQNTSATSRTISGKGNNTYGYRIRACNNIGCTAYSAEKRINVALTPGTPSSISAPTPHDGDFTVSWGIASGSITQYELEQRVNGGDYTNVYTGTATSQSILVAGAGSYYYRVRGCKAVGSNVSCSGWQTTSSASIAAVPGSVPSLSGPTSNASGSYSVSWGGVTNSRKYTLQERSGTGSWATLQDISATSRSISGKGSNTYGYRIRACNNIGCTAYSAEKRIDVALTPGMPSNINAPILQGGDFTVSWDTGSGSITQYELEQRFNNGDYTNIYTGTATSQPISVASAGSYDYRVRACKTVGGNVSCSGWKATSSSSTATAPSSAPELSGPTSNTSGNYSVSWGGVSLATSYRWQEGTGSSWSNEQTTSGTSATLSKTQNATYKYRVRACNKLGCGGYSSEKTVSVNIASTIDTPQVPALATAPAPSTSIDQSKTLAGEFNVTPGGQASYNIDVLTARGTAGLAPRVSLGYASGGGNGLAGLGWSLSAGSQISRCRQTEGQDRNALAIAWGQTDRFCLNGQRLLVQDGAVYGAPGSTYKTEIDSYARITAVGGTTGYPNAFTVEHKNGLVENYGATTDSKLQLNSSDSKTVLTWAINERFDALNNRIEFNYYNDADGQRLEEINFAYGNGSSPGAQIAFEYDPRDDIISGYVAGYEKRTAKRLKNIKSYSNEQLLREYKLSYDTGTAATDNDKLSRISEIQECVGSTCSQPTVFEWSIPENSYASANYSYTLPGGAGIEGAGGAPIAMGDINGDGVTDVAWMDTNSALRYAFGSVTDSGSFVFSSATFTNGAVTAGPADGQWAKKLAAIDANGDGRTDIAYKDSLWVSTPLADGRWVLSATPVSIPKYGDTEPGQNTIYTTQFADVNGDGLADFLRMRLVDEKVGDLWNYQSELVVNYLSINPGEPATSPNYYAYSEGQLLENNYSVECTSGDDEYDCDFQLSSVKVPVRLNQVGPDFNGDGRVDFMASGIYQIDCSEEDQDGLGAEACNVMDTTIYPYVVTANGNEGLKFEQYASEIVNGFSVVYGVQGFNFSTSTPDLNGDGLSDLFRRVASSYKYRLSTGLGFAEEKSISLPHAWGQHPTLLDMNFDGHPDIVWLDDGGHAPGELSTHTLTRKVNLWDPATNSFEVNPIDLSTESLTYIYYKYLTYHNDSVDLYAYREGQPTTRNQMRDLDSDGYPDMVWLPADDGNQIRIKKNLQSVVTTSKNKIVGVAKGHGHQIDIAYEPIAQSDHYSRIGGIGTAEEEHCWIEIVDDEDDDVMEVCGNVVVADEQEFYRNINTPWHALHEKEQSLTPATPVLEAFGSSSVVTRVETSATAANDSVGQAGQIDSNVKNTHSYYYANAKIQAGGRGYLGFESMSVVNEHSGLKTVTKSRQDWPFNGRPRSKTVLSEEGFVLSQTRFYDGFVTCVDETGPIAGCADPLAETAANSGTAELGPLQIYTHEVVAKSYALAANGTAQGDLVSESVTNRVLDNKGNMEEETVVVHGMDESSNTEALIKVLDKTSDYGYVFKGEGESWSQQLGRLETAEVTTSREASSNNPAYDTVTQSKAFTYTEEGMVQTETLTVSPDATGYSQATTHSYDSFGNRQYSTIAADGQTRYSPESDYDDRGRFVDAVYDRFTSGDNPAAGTRIKVSDVVSRDKYGTPTETRAYMDRTNTGAYTTQTAATTAFGTPYFTASSEGASAATTMGSGTYGVCSQSHNVYWQLETTATGNQTLGCFDVQSRPIRQATLSYDGSDWVVVDTEYDILGRVLRKSEPYFANAGASKWTENSGMDILGRVTDMVGPVREDGGRPRTQISYVNNRKTTTAHNNSAEGPSTLVRTEITDGLGKIIQVTDPADGITAFAYDARGNLRLMTDPSQVNQTQITFDALNRKTWMNDPDKGEWRYVYNTFGEITCQQDANGQVIQQVYDIRGRLYSRTDRVAASGSACESPTGGVQTYSQWQYDTASNGLGQLEQMWDSGTVGGSARYTQSHSYDNFGRIGTTTTSFPDHSGAITGHYEKATYDQYGRVFQTFDGARTSADFSHNGIQHVYNNQGYLSAVVDVESFNGYRMPYYTVVNMDQRGNITNAEYGNGVTQENEYYADSGLAKIIKAWGGQLVGSGQFAEYQWDMVGNLQSRSEKGSGSFWDNYQSGRDIEESYTYDALNRLNTWTSTGDITEFAEVTYSNIDNIESKTGIGTYDYGSDCSSSQNAGPHAVCRITDDNNTQTLYYYDHNGNLLSDGSGRTLTYSVFDKPLTIQKGSHTTSFQYGPSRARFKRVDVGAEGTTSTLYIGGVEKIKYPDNKIVWKRKVAGVAIETEHVSQQTRELHFLHYDHLGSLSLITDEIGGDVEEHYFDPWGDSRKANRETDTWEDTQPFLKASKPITSRGYTDHEMLDEVELVHMNGRIYDAKIARFVQADPIIQDPLRVQSLNRYSYVWNNPLNAVDPSGFEAETKVRYYNTEYAHGFVGSSIGSTSKNKENTDAGKEQKSKGTSSQSNNNKASGVTFDPESGGGEESQVEQNSMADTQVTSGVAAVAAPAATAAPALEEMIVEGTRRAGNAISHYMRNSLRVAAARFVTHPATLFVAGMFVPGNTGYDRCYDMLSCMVNGVEINTATGMPVSYGGETTSPGGWPGGDDPNNKGGLFRNQVPGSLSQEMQAAKNVGANPMVAARGTQMEGLVNQGTIKWVVNSRGQLIVSSHTVRGQEISHAVLSGGRPVMAAGQAEIAASNGQFIGMRITTHSGHFMRGTSAAQNARAMQVGVDAFRKIGIGF